jgi:hypothetical protein
MRINGEPSFGRGAVCGGPPQPTLRNAMQFGLAFARDHGDPEPHYERVDYESTCIDCRKVRLHAGPRFAGRLGWST